MSRSRVISIDSSDLSLRDVADVASGFASVRLAEDELRKTMSRSVEVVRDWVDQGRRVYGITTGFGASCDNAIPRHVLEELAVNLPRYHGCGIGPLLSEEQSAAVLLTCIRAMTRGVSGVRYAVIERMTELLKRRLLPVIPSIGSVGASGDLTPMSYVVAVLIGEREVYVDGEIRPASILSDLHLPPLSLGPKESLSLMNGTSAMTGLMCLAWRRAERLARFSAALSASTVDVLHGQAAHFDARIFEAKPHAGSRLAARWIREDLGVENHPDPHGGRIQDVYSLRCSPHVIGALLDGLSFAKEVVEVELNGSSDNPLVDPERGEPLHGGNFYGGHIAMVADLVKSGVANLGDLADRQLALLNNPRTNRGLPENLVAVDGDAGLTHHGFKAMEISASALAAEALKLTMPASVFSRSTEGHNQDKVSMGTIAVRDCNAILDLVETIHVIHLLALCQAADLRGIGSASPRTRLLHDAVRRCVPINSADRRMDQDIARVLAMYRAEELPAGEDQAL
jgi:histidine ammonia-lyase